MAESVQAHVTPDVAERVAAGGAVACVQHLASEPLAIWSSHAVLVQACNQVSECVRGCAHLLLAFASPGVSIRLLCRLGYMGL